MTGSLGLDNELSVTWKAFFCIFPVFVWPGGALVAKPDYSPLTTVFEAFEFCRKKLIIMFLHILKGSALYVQHLRQFYTLKNLTHKCKIVKRRNGSCSFWRTRDFPLAGFKSFPLHTSSLFLKNYFSFWKSFGVCLNSTSGTASVYLFTPSLSIHPFYTWTFYDETHFTRMCNTSHVSQPLKSYLMVSCDVQLLHGFVWSFKIQITTLMMKAV
jgi:hypothetical protein